MNNLFSLSYTDEKIRKMNRGEYYKSKRELRIMQHIMTDIVKEKESQLDDMFLDLMLYEMAAIKLDTNQKIDSNTNNEGI